ncbi:rhamnogalacturonan acetylesterase [Mariniflexile litorale]|uniref:Rhamnogalacturonan acetylesterase n=1 Tax=Mariniflexile litorale TaxID=3045158 RepID=A0AAU7EL56_9FLAO|nr:rhamnogalacturonan acetylesterase [Mariniflexile sp. KMM 9835]MDQ8210641.1 rhamnogalacturonan acetylesterase [Mariniflexile sp. KMM 9835]
MIPLKHIFFLLLHIVFLFNTTAQNNLSQSFNFGINTNEKNTTYINNPILYNDALGYGFDFQSGQNIKFKKNFITSKQSIYFSVKLPEGNYKINVVLGGKKCSTTTIKAESRRLMLKEITLDKNNTTQQSFTVNIRSPKINTTEYIKVKDRDKNQLNWDDKLTLEFSGTPVIQSVKISPVSNVKTLFLAGDSTVTDQDLEPWASWGQFITNYFNSDIVVANYAESGATLSSFKGTKRLDKILTFMKPNDYVFIEFGHNDEKIKGEGNGAWGLYTNSLKEFITKFREKGGSPVLVTPTQRRAFNNDGTLKPTHGDFPDAMRKVAIDLQVPLIDITEMTTYMYESWGNDGSRNAFVQYPANTFPGQAEKLEDNTHFNSFGANEIAKGVVQSIKDLKLDIAQYLKPNLPNYNPKKPDNFSDWTLPMSTRFENSKPDGN